MQVHFIAIGGSAMHNLAMALQDKGYTISGSDDEIFEPSYSRLKSRGLLPQALGWFPEKIHLRLDAVILGMHARSDNPELLRAQELGVKIYSYPEYLYQQSIDKERVVIAGSHGKTTITAMILHVLKQAGIDTDYMVGAQLDGFEVMVRLSKYAKWMILEGDEYLTSPIDRRPKFLHYHPHIAVLSGIGWDHYNVFPNFDQYLDQFRQLLAQLEPDGQLFYFEEDEVLEKLLADYTLRSQPYGVHPYQLSDKELSLVDRNGAKYPVKLFGRHNFANISAAKAVCSAIGVADDVFYDAIQSFAGASKRMEQVAVRGDRYLFRDFAHAPSKLQASVEALRERFPNHQLVICFELHTFSSMSEGFIDHYKHTLDKADVACVFYDPHAVAMKRLPMMSDKRISEGFGRSLSVIKDSASLVRALQAISSDNNVVALMSSGSFGGLDVQALLSEIGF